MPRAIPCTSSDDPERVASEPLLLQEYVHGNCGGLYEQTYPKEREDRIGIKGKKLPLTHFCHIVNYVSVFGPEPSGIHKNLV